MTPWVLKLKIVICDFLENKRAFEVTQNTFLVSQVVSLVLKNKIAGATFNGAMKSNFKHYSFVMIIFFNTALYKSAFFTYSFGKLGFCLSMIFMFSACSVLSLM